MTDKEKIIAEIERLYCEEAEKYDTSQEIGAKRILDKLSNFINSLPAEQPSEEFKGEFDDYLVHGDIRNPNFDGPFGYDDIRKTAIHFANWQKEQMLKSAIDAIVDEDTENSYIKTLVFIGKQCDALNTRISNYEYGEMVKIIIIKEDE